MRVGKNIVSLLDNTIFSYHSNTQQYIINLLYCAVSKIIYSLKWAVDELKLFSQGLHYIRYLITAERDYECHILLRPIFAFRQKQLVVFNNF